MVVSGAAVVVSAEETASVCPQETSVAAERMPHMMVENSCLFFMMVLPYVCYLYKSVYFSDMVSRFYLYIITQRKGIEKIGFDSLS